MEMAREITRLNLVLEFASECAGLADYEAVVRVLSDRARWIFDYASFALLVSRADADAVWSMGAGDESPAHGQLDDLPAEQADMLREVLTSGAPRIAGEPICLVAHPLRAANAVVGAICLSSAEHRYSHRDLRLLYHISVSLGAALSRIRQQELLDRQRREMQAQTHAAETQRIAREAAESASQAKDTFLAMLAHELRNPLAPIVTSALILRRLADGAIVRQVDIIDRQSRHLMRLLDDLLDVSRVTGGKVRLVRAIIDLRTVVDEAAEAVAPKMAEKTQNFEYARPQAPLLVDGDATRLIQVVANLLNNASSYSPRGAHIRVAARSNGSEVILTVADDGEGIAAETLRTMFEVFVQGKRDAQRPSGGLGLGLAVSRALIEMHGGTIEGSSPGPGQGSEFTVRIPAAEGHEARVAAVDGAADPLRAAVPMRVLLVDDNVDAADSMVEILRMAGHDVCVAYHPSDALAAAEKFRPHIAILDIGLPSMNGRELGAELKRRLDTESPILIALSGYGQPGDHALSMERGFAEHLVKPIAPARLLEAIDRVARKPATTR